MYKRYNLTGQVFGCLEVIEFSHSNSKKENYWKCKCSCGRDKCEGEIVVRAHNLLSGRRTQCNKGRVFKQFVGSCEPMTRKDLTRKHCDVCLRKTPHVNDVCSWH